MHEVRRARFGHAASISNPELAERPKGKHARVLYRPSGAALEPGLSYGDSGCDWGGVSLQRGVRMKEAIKRLLTHAPRAATVFRVNGVSDRCIMNYNSIVYVVK